MSVEIINFQTAMGKVIRDRDKLHFLSDEEMEEFNQIGYSGKNLKGEKTSRIEFLNSLGKGDFTLNRTKADTGDFVEEFTIARSTIDVRGNGKSHTMRNLIEKAKAKGLNVIECETMEDFNKILESDVKSLVIINDIDKKLNG